MKRFFQSLIGTAAVTAATSYAGDLTAIPFETINGEKTSLADYKGKVVLIVNTASRCGLTKQYAGLEALQDKYGEKGFSVIAFPCNDFGKQEPGTELEIKKFCTDNYSVTFPLHSKIEVNGKGAHPLYKKLKKESGGSDKIGWNFEKFLLDGNGKVIKRFSPRTKPDAPEVIAAIEKALK